MTKEQIEGSKLIAELMGGGYKDVTIAGQNVKRFYLPNAHITEYINPDDLEYHESWDLLMPAIRKAKALPNSANYIGWERLNYYLLRCEIKETFEELVLFAIWYNQNKQS